MPIQLTNPVLAGAFDPGAAEGEYAQVRICVMEWDYIQQSIGVKCVYGNTVSGSWISGKLEKQIGIQNIAEVRDGEGNVVNAAQPNYTDLVTMLAVGSTPIYKQVGDALYNFLIDKDYFDGTVVA